MLPPTPSKPLETRQRILESAGRIFAEQGFEKATIREICAAAGANLAAVNYHFGDKRTLYHEVLAHYHGAALAARPIPRLADRPDDPAERLGTFIRWFLWLLLGGGTPAWLGKMMAREMAAPTAALDGMVERTIRPIFLAASEIVRALVAAAGQDVEPDRLRRFTMSVLGQCLVYKHGQAVIARLQPDLEIDDAELERLAAHVTAFSLAAIRHVGGDGSEAVP